MSRNCVFTIVANNYLSLAITLQGSLKEHHPDWDFYIIVADSLNEDQKLSETQIGVFALGIPNLLELAMKYNVTEFCTAVKPFAFSHLFNQKQYARVIYFDPDIVIFNKLDPIVDGLNQKSIVLTPHFITSEINYSGTVPEGGILFLGLFNLGFIGLKYSDKSILFLEWWKNRLQDKCYADKIDGFHTDQKWLDFAVILFKDDVQIVFDLGCNMAFWNLHERKLFKNNDQLFVVNRLLPETENSMLKFFHFAGFDIKDTSSIHKYHKAYSIDDYPEIREIMDDYRIKLIDNGFGNVKTPYLFAEFETGDTITQFHRRFFRRLVEMGYKFDNPFRSGENSFYELLKKNSLLSTSKINPDKLGKDSVGSFESKVKLINFLMRMIKRIIGFDRYTMLMKFALRYVRPENQVFLINEVARKYEFFHEGAWSKKLK